MAKQDLKITYIKISELKPAPYNPRRWDKSAEEQLDKSFEKYGIVDPLIVNCAPERFNIVIGGHFRLHIAKKQKMSQVPVVYVNIPDVERELELNLRLNRNHGDWDWQLLAEFDESLLADVGFTSEELDDIFNIETDHPEVFDLEKELKKLKIEQIAINKGDIYQLGDSRLMCGDSTIEADVLKLMNGEQADAVVTDPPYILSYLKGGKRRDGSTTGFGAKKNRRYLETDELPDDFTELWMSNIAKIAKPDFSIICYENWKNIPVIWGEMTKHWTIRNMIVWFLPNRHQNFAAKHKFFSKHDIAMLGTSGEVELNTDPEDELLQNEYETALYATSGNPHWEGYRSGKKIQPTDHIEFNAADEKSSGQGVIFGVKPLEILIPYIKVLTKRGDLIVEPFCGSGSTLIAAIKLKRRCFVMEKSNVYAEIAIRRWEQATGFKREKLS